VKLLSAYKALLKGIYHYCKSRNKSLVCCFLLLNLLYHFSLYGKNEFNLFATNSLKFQTESNQSVNPPKNITSSITYEADSLIKQDLLNNRIELFENASLSFEDVKLTAAYIRLDNNTGLIFARGIYDENGAYTQRPLFNQDGQESEQDSIKFNFKTRKAKVWNVEIEYQELTIKGASNKVLNDSVFFFEDVRFTTSKKEKPDYYIRTSKAKYIKGKKLIAGASQLYIADVPTPLFLPFAYIPLTRGRASGILVPTWGENQDQGYFLQNGGYYLVINDKLDLALKGDVYSNGSWGLNTLFNYKKRYKYDGDIEMSYENLKNSISGLSDFSKSTNYNFRWNHSQDAKSNPNATLSASVNLGSSNFFRQSLNQLNTDSFLTNTLNSSITYSRAFQGTPFNASATFTHTQNTNTEIIDMTLPSFQINMERIFPFAGKSGSKQNDLQKTGVSYSLQSENRLATNDNDFLTSKMFDNLRSGIQQNIDVSTNFKAFKNFAISPSIKYKEVWYFDRTNQFFDQSLNSVTTETIDKFSTFRDFSTAVSLSTTFYGLYNFKKGPYRSVLHTMIPSISYSYNPDVSTIFNNTYQASADPNDIQSYSPFENGIYGSPNAFTSNSLGVSVTNNFEAKLKPKEENSEMPLEKTTLINNLNFSSSYNMAADSLRWSAWSVNASTNLFKKKLSMNMRATLDPYTIDENGTRINTYTIENNEGLFRVTNAGLDLSYSISSSEIKKSDRQLNKIENNSEGIFGESSSVANKYDTIDEKEPSEQDINLFSYQIPWSLNLNYTLDYQNSNRQNEISSNSLMFSGNLELTPKWSVGFSSGYDIENEGFTFTSLSFARDLDTWKMNFNWVPFGTRQTYYFFIGVKSSMLEALKFEMRGLPNNTVF